MRMVEAGDRHRLPLKALSEVLRLGELGVSHLHRQAPSQAGVLHRVDGARSARAQHSGHAVAVGDDHAIGEALRLAHHLNVPAPRTIGEA